MIGYGREGGVNVGRFQVQEGGDSCGYVERLGPGGPRLACMPHGGGPWMGGDPTSLEPLMRPSCSRSVREETRCSGGRSGSQFLDNYMLDR